MHKLNKQIDYDIAESLLSNARFNRLFVGCGGGYWILLEGVG